MFGYQGYFLFVKENSLSLSLRIPVYEDASNQKTFKDAIHKGITLHATILKDAEALVDGNLVSLGNNFPLLYSMFVFVKC